MKLALRSIADGTIDVGAWIGARVGLGGVRDALLGHRDVGAPGGPPPARGALADRQNADYD